METTWWIVLVVLVLAIALIVFLIKRNNKDEKDLIEYLDKEEPQDNIDK